MSPTTIEQPTLTSYTPNEILDAIGSDLDGNVTVEHILNQRAETPTEAFAMVKAVLLEEHPSDGRDGWWRYRWRKTYTEPSAEFVATARRFRTTGHRLRHYLDVVSGASNKSGRTLVYKKREVIAEEMGCSIATVGRCRRAANELGYHAGKQLRWFDPDHGMSAWSGGPSMLVLTAPAGHNLTTPARCKRKAREQRRATAIDRAAYERAQEAKAAKEAQAEQLRVQNQAGITLRGEPRAPKRRVLDPAIKARNAEHKARFAADNP